MCKALDNTQTHLMFDSISFNLKTKQSALREYSIGSFLPGEFSGDPCIYQIGFMDTALQVPTNERNERSNKTRYYVWN